MRRLLLPLLIVCAALAAVLIGSASHSAGHHRPPPAPGVVASSATERVKALRIARAMSPQQVDLGTSWTPVAQASFNPSLACPIPQDGLVALASTTRRPPMYASGVDRWAVGGADVYETATMSEAAYRLTSARTHARCVAAALSNDASEHLTVNELVGRPVAHQVFWHRVGDGVRVYRIVLPITLNGRSQPEVSYLFTVRVGRGVSTYLLDGPRRQDALAERVTTAIANRGTVSQE